MSTPDFTDLLRLDMKNYFIGRGFTRQEARIRARELLAKTLEIAEEFK